MRICDAMAGQLSGQPDGGLALARMYAPAWHSQLVRIQYLVRIPGAHDISCANNEAGFDRYSHWDPDLGSLASNFFIRHVISRLNLSRNGRCVIIVLRFLSF